MSQSSFRESIKKSQGKTAFICNRFEVQRFSSYSQFGANKSLLMAPPEKAQQKICYLVGLCLVSSAPRYLTKLVETCWVRILSVQTGSSKKSLVWLMLAYKRYVYEKRGKAGPIAATTTAVFKISLNWPLPLTLSEIRKNVWVSSSGQSDRTPTIVHGPLFLVIDRTLFEMTNKA